jgi:hypothetical protein
MAKAKVAPDTKVSITASTPIIYDGVRYETGETFEIREVDLQQLLDSSAAAVAVPAA